MKRYFPIIILLIFSLAYLLPRLINISQSLEFNSDQGIHLSESRDMVINRQFRLLGPEVSSKSYDGRHFYIGATYYYVLALLGVILNWSPLSVTVAIIIFEFSLYAIFINYLRRNFGYLPSIIVGLIIALSPYLIFHSLFFWNPHFLIPLSILFIIFRKNPYLSAFFWGLALSFHYTALIWLLPYLIFRIRYRQFHLLTLFISLITFSIANLPFLISEFRHEFYNLKTIFLIFTHSSESFQVTAHYIVFPLIIFVIYFLIYYSQKFHFPLYLVCFLFFLVGDQAMINKTKSWNYPTQLIISQNISKSCPPNFNIATTIQADTRAYNLRYLLDIDHCSPNGVINYPQSKTIFLIAPPTRPPETELVWEIDSFKPFKTTQAQKLNDHVIFYRLDKN